MAKKRKMDAPENEQEQKNDEERKEVKQEVINEIYSYRKPRPEFHITAGYPGQIIQFDLLDVSQDAKQNKGVTFLACFIDVNSRYGWAFPLKSKGGLIKAFEGIIEKIRSTNPANVDRIRVKRIESGQEPEGGNTPFPEYIYSDAESVAKSKEINNYIDKEGIKWVKMKPGEKTPTAMIERFNLNLRVAIRNYMETKKTKKYIDQLPTILSDYNRTQNDVTKKSPNAIFLKGAVFKDKRPNLEPSIHIGDYVRTRINRTEFAKKSRVANWSRAIYQVVGNASPFRFTIQEIGAEEPEALAYKPEALKKIKYDETTHTELPEDEKKQEVLDEKQQESKVQRAIQRGLKDLDVIKKNLIPSNPSATTRTTRGNVKRNTRSSKK